MKGLVSMKKIISVCALALFISAGIIGCSSTPSTGGGGSTTSNKGATVPPKPADKPADKPAEKPKS
jgi:hypothetical protein